MQAVAKEMTALYSSQGSKQIQIFPLQKTWCGWHQRRGATSRSWALIYSQTTAERDLGCHFEDNHAADRQPLVRCPSNEMGSTTEMPRHWWHPTRNATGTTTRTPLWSCCRAWVQLRDPAPREVPSDGNAPFFQAKRLHGSILQGSSTYVSSTSNKSYCMLIKCQWSKENIFVED